MSFRSILASKKMVKEGVSASSTEMMSWGRSCCSRHHSRSSQSCSVLCTSLTSACDAHRRTTGVDPSTATNVVLTCEGEEDRVPGEGDESKKKETSHTIALAPCCTPKFPYLRLPLATLPPTLIHLGFGRTIE